MRCHPDVLRRPAAVEPLPDDVRGDRVVAFPPHRCRDRDDLTDDRLARHAPIGHRWAHIVDPDPTRHRRTPD